jgi:serine/threonine-protein kinase
MTPCATAGGAPQVNRKVDRYELLEEVGSGGMAVVYRGRDTALDREVAVKLLHPHLAARAESRARFSREARAVARLSHPNIVEIYDYAGDAAVESFLVTEFVRGRTLRAFAEQTGLGFPEIGALVARALADALVHAHSAGVIHRDLKPENVLVLEDGGRRAIKLVDFGIARILAADEKMTMTGALVGSPNHMAPEIIEGRESDTRSDIFSLGTILYWLATGAMPFAAPNPTATLRRVIEGDYQDPRALAPAISDELAAVIARALALDPADRFPSAAELRQALDAVLAEAGIQDPARELAAFLADPTAHKAAFPARLAAALSARAEEALRAGSTARALKLWNRVLAVDPGNQSVLRDLARIERRARLGRALRRAGIALAGVGVAAAAVGLYLTLRTAQGPPPPAPPAAQAPPSALGAAPPPAGPRAQGPGAPAGPAPAPAGAPAHAVGSAAGPGVHAVRAPPRRPIPIAVTIHVRPYAQRALLDGVEVARGTQRVVLSLEPGKPHRLEIVHPCCNTFVREFAADEAIPQPLELKVPLQPRPALLRVQADPDAQVFVDGKLVGTAAESQRAPIPVPVPPDGESPYEGDAEIRIETAGRPTYATTARIRAGADLTVVASGEEATP